MKKQPVVYLMASKHHGTLYIGVTSNLVKRVWQHKHEEAAGFTRKYHIHDLVWYEQHETMNSAIQREKHIKAWKREWKIKLIEKANPNWEDLYDSITSYNPVN